MSLTPEQLNIVNGVKLQPEEVVFRKSKTTEPIITITDSTQLAYTVKIDCDADGISIEPNEFLHARLGRFKVKYDGSEIKDSAVITVNFDAIGTFQFSKTIPVRFLEDVENGEEEDSTLPCAQNPSHEAVVFCDWCKTDFCEECFENAHSKGLRGHKMIPIADKPIQLPKCPKHAYNSAEFVCKEPSCGTESKLMCRLCLLQDHKNHAHEKLLDKLMENKEKAIEMIEKLKKEIAKDTQLKEAIEVKKKLEMMVKSKNDLHLVDEVSQKVLEICGEVVEKESDVPLNSSDEHKDEML